MKPLALSLLLISSALAVPPPLLPPEVPGVVIDELMDDVRVTVTYLGKGDYEYVYEVDNWTTKEQLAEIGKPKGGFIEFFRNEGKVAIGYRQLSDVKQLKPFEARFSTPLDGQIMMRFVTKGKPVLGRFLRGVKVKVPGMWVGSSWQHSECWVPGPVKEAL